MSKKVGRRIIPSVIAVVLIAALIAGNILISRFSYVINQALAGDTTDYGSASAELQEGDEIVQALGEESMVLLKNEDGFLPLDKTEKVNLFGWAATDQGFLLVGGGSGGGAGPRTRRHPPAPAVAGAVRASGSGLCTADLPGPDLGAVPGVLTCDLQAAEDVL